jgi:AraC family transcriptional activator of pobA
VQVARAAVKLDFGASQIEIICMSHSFDVEKAGREAEPSVPQYALYGEAVADTGHRRVSICCLSDKLKARGWRIQPHTHPHYSQILLVRAGGGTVTMEGRASEFCAQAVLVVPALLVHGFDYDQRTDGWVITVANSYLRDIEARAPELAAVFSTGRCIQYPEADQTFAEVERSVAKLEAEQCRSFVGRDIATEGLLIDVLVNVVRRMQDSDFQPTLGNGSAHEKYRRFLSLIEKHYRHNWSLEQFAQELGTTVTRLRGICREVSGESPIRLLNNRVMIEAQRSLIYTQMSVSEIAYRLGFEDPSYFSRFFRARCGETPSQYKARLLDARRAINH